MFPITVSPNPDGLKIKNGLGNHFLTFLFCCSLAERHGYNVVLACKSDLESVLDLKVAYDPSVVNWQAVISENSCFVGSTPKEAAALSQKQLDEAKVVLSTGVVCNVIVEGNYFHLDLHRDLPYYERFFSIKPHPRLVPDDSVVIHHRGLDFKNHLKKIYSNSICLTTDYYERAIDEARRRLGASIDFRVFTDDPKDAVATLPKVDYTIMNTDSAESWLSLYHAENIICSNSSFCWTAALWKKNLRIMPAGGYNCNYPGTGVVPAGFYLPGAIVI